MSIKKTRYRRKNAEGTYDIHHFETEIDQVIGLVDFIKKNFPNFAFVPSVDANGDLSWSNSAGMQNPQTVNIKGQQGVNGTPGAAATISIGAVSTGTAGSNAAVTNSGTANAAKLNFTIPCGATGATGPQGPAGAGAIIAGSLAQNGWVKFANGLILQWGSVSVIPAWGVNYINYPIAFKINPLGIVATAGATQYNHPNYAGTNVEGIGNRLTGFSIVNSSTTIATLGGTWVAVGA